MRDPDSALAHRFSAEEEAATAAFRPLVIAGTPETVRRRIEEAAERSGADEVMIASHTSDAAERIRSYALIAQAFGLPSAR